MTGLLAVGCAATAPVTGPGHTTTAPATATAPAFDNGWVDVYSSPCSGQVKHRGLPVALDRADFNGFWSYIGTHSGCRAGVYSDQATWTQECIASPGRPKMGQHAPPRSVQWS